MNEKNTLVTLDRVTREKLRIVQTRLSGERRHAVSVREAVEYLIDHEAACAPAESGARR